MEFDLINTCKYMICLIPRDSLVSRILSTSRPAVRSRVYTIGFRNGVDIGPDGLAGVRGDLETLISYVQAKPLHHLDMFVDALVKSGPKFRGGCDLQYEAKYASFFGQAVEKAKAAGSLPQNHLRLLVEKREDRMSEVCGAMLDPWSAAQVDAYHGRNNELCLKSELCSL